MKKKVVSLGILVLLLLITLVPAKVAKAADLAKKNVTTPADPSGATYDFYLVAKAVQDEGEDSFYFTPETAFSDVLEAKRDGNKALLWKTKSSKEVDNTLPSGEKIELAKELEGKISGALAVQSNIAAGTQVSLDPGYYLVIGKGPEILSPILASVTDEDVPLTAKASDIDFDKKILDVNETTDGAVSSTGNTAVAGEKDIVHYQLETHIPAYGSEVKELETDFTVMDKLSEGLTFNNDTAADGEKVKVYVADSEVTASAATWVLDTDDTDDEGEDFTFKVTFADSYVLNNENQPVKITFGAVVNSNAVIGTGGNPNEGTLKFSNEFSTGKGEGELDDEVKVYTAQLKVFKYQGSDVPLSGAAFTLYKDNQGEKGDPVGEPQTTKGDGNISFKDLAPGTYILEETTAPHGYHKHADMTITITASTDGSSFEFNGKFTYSGGPGEDGTVKVENIPGSVLPGTGGIGTRIFQIVGIGIVLLAGGMLFFFLKRRHADEGK